MHTVVITGISRGIGQALAQRFLDAGDRVIGTSMDGLCGITHEHLSVVLLDLSSSKSIAACAAAITAAAPTIDLLINNAGVLLDEEETSLVPEKLRQTFEINVIGTADLTERLLPCVHRGGHIIAISSTAGSIGNTGHPGSHFPGHYPAYKISKAALNMYMRTLAVRLQNNGITVSAVHPGWVQTSMGGQEADLTPQEAAENIYQFTQTPVTTGNFWFKDQQLPW